MFSDKTKKYRIAASKADFLDSFPVSNEIAQSFSFGEVLFKYKNDKIYAFHNKCPHQGAKMQGCDIQDGRLICPVHRYSFDTETGRGSGLYLDFYELEENKDGFYLLRTYFRWLGE